jgi:transcriptional regulator with XRE-family HTH domain
MKLGRVLKNDREAMGLSIRHRASEIGIPHTALWRLERDIPVDEKQWVRVMMWMISEQNDNNHHERKNNASKAN